MNTVTESDIYDNYTYTSCVNSKIEMTSETPSKKLEFYIDNPETGLKKIDFNIITNTDEIDDLSDWNSSDSHKCELTISYDNKVGNKTLCPRTFCWISNNNTLDITCTPNAHEARQPLVEFDFTITIPVI